MQSMSQNRSKEKSNMISLRSKIHDIIFDTDTWSGKLFDVVLIWAISISVIVVMLESVEELASQWGGIFRSLEWFFTILFSIEFILRLYSVSRPLKYVFSFFGIVDILSILPTYLSLVLVGSHYLLSIRILRLLRIFRIFKLTRYMKESRSLVNALKLSMPKITVFLGAIMTLAVVMGTLMYLIEGKENGFTSIPRGIYWAVVTLTTVGYGDISPKTPFGQFLSSLLMILGYGIIAVPTGIISVGLAEAKKIDSSEACTACGADIYDSNAKFCNRCGHALR